MKKLILAFGAMSTLAVACGSDGPSTQSGVSGSRLVSDITMAEATKVCTYIVDELLGAERTVTCANGDMGPVGVPAAERQAEINDCAADAVADAVEFPNCAITIKELEDCYEAIIALNDEMRYCSDTAPVLPACDRLDAKIADPTCSTPPAAN